MEFKDILTKERKSKGYSQEALADLLGVSRQSISKWENGEAYPDFQKLLLLSDTLECSLEYLCGRSDQSSAIATPTGQSTVSKRTLLWVIILGVLIPCLLIGAIVITSLLGCKFILQPAEDLPTVTLTPSTKLPDSISASAIRLNGSSTNGFTCSLVPSIVAEDLTYQLVFKNDIGIRTFSGTCNNGLVSCSGNIGSGQYHSLFLIISNGTDSRTTLIARDIHFNETGSGWTAAE